MRLDINKDNKAQAALEFSLLTLFLLTLGLVVIGASGYLMLQYQENSIEEERAEFVQVIQEEFAAAQSSPNGYYREITISDVDLNRFKFYFINNSSLFFVTDSIQDPDEPFNYSYYLDDSFRYNVTFFYENTSTGAKIIINKTLDEEFEKVIISGINLTSPPIIPPIFSPADSFVSVWDTTLLSPGSSGSSSISLPLESTGSYNFFVDWGDGDVDFITAFNQPEVTHTYASSGVYTVTINGTLRGFRFNNAGDKNKILDISQWGNMNLGNNARQFIGAENLDISATDAPDLTGITTFSVMFFNTSSLGNVNFSSWDVSAVTVMENMFNSAPNFNGDLSGWDVSNVVDMNQMFYSANSFDGDLSNWDVSNVEDMQRLFSATSFSGNISSWDTSSVTNMFEMFRSVPGFDYDISGWDVDQVTICDDFSLATNVTWNTPEKPLFLNCTPEYFPITAFVSIWDTTQTSTGSSGSNSVELPLGSSGNYNFQVDWGDGTSDIITSYNQGAVQHNYSSPGTYTIIIEGQIQGFRFNNDRDRNKIVDISQWGNLNLGNLGSYFYGAENLDISAIDAPNLTGTTDFRNIFNGANSLTNPDFSKWKTGNVTTLLLGFAGATNFNGNISTWNMSNVIDLTLTFSSASSFDQDLNNWDVSSVENMLSTFFFASNFNGNIGNWDVSRVENMRNTFFSASNFNQDLSGWDTGSVLDMERTFSNANSFNQDLSGWDVDQVTSCFDFNISTSSWVLPKPAFSSC